MRITKNSLPTYLFKAFKRFYAVVSFQLIKFCIYPVGNYRLYNHCGDIAWRIHLFSFRTQKLSFSAPKVLAGWPAGRIGRCHIPLTPFISSGVFYIFFKVSPLECEAKCRESSSLNIWSYTRKSVPTRRSNVKQGRYQSSLFYIL